VAAVVGHQVAVVAADFLAVAAISAAAAPLAVGRT
jgi:hypothetical protein